jgi:hypothetical protein
VVKFAGRALFDPPASFAAPQGSAVLGWRAIEPVGCDHLDTLSSQQLIETVTIVSFVTDDSGRCALSNHESKELLDEMAFSWTRSTSSELPCVLGECFTKTTLPANIVGMAIGVSCQIGDWEEPRAERVPTGNLGPCFCQMDPLTFTNSTSCSFISTRLSGGAYTCAAIPASPCCTSFSRSHSIGATFTFTVS